MKSAGFSEYYVNMSLNIWEDFQICIRVPLIIDKIIVLFDLKMFFAIFVFVSK